MPGSFFDSNILAYLASGDSTKADRAEAALRDGGTISVQVLNEVANVARRKMRMSWQETHDLLSSLRGLLTVHPVTVETHDLGLALAERYDLAIYDALVAASALLAGCDRLWSEDMGDGMAIDRRLRIVNPFRERGR
jgi:predicted nucleic acid-binding protein